MSDFPEALDVVDNTERHRFEVRLGADVAFAEYQLGTDALTLPHTEVPPAFEGKGVASRLAKFAMAYARERGLTIVPTCPFMAGYMKKHAETHDLVDASCRGELGI